MSKTNTANGVTRESNEGREYTEEEKQLDLAIQRINENAREEDTRPSTSLSLKEIIGGEILNAKFIRSQLWLILLIAAFTLTYVAFRYQCQQDIIIMDKMEKELKDAKYKALSCSSSLTEKCRESKILEKLKANKDSTIHISDQPPYIINIPEK
ncbi:hypothetical protein HPS56_09580 [Prevotella sp. PMUR]|uniref:Cell division protein FtsL n=1 Tax=Xylanibacter muris TaxID=2736290 RepID=A0ABX2AN80_9BACT|nr:hypothetical protein [Xylanibacter muris]